MNNLTKLVCDLISFGSQLGTASATNEQIGRSVRYTCVTRLPEDCDVIFEQVDEHIANCRAAMLGSDNDIDKVRTALAQGKPVSIKRITEFHNKLSVHLSNGRVLSFNATDIVHY